MPSDPPPEQAPYARLLSVGTHRPARRISNDEIAQWISVSPGWIKRRTGISERRFAGPGEDVVSMAVSAGSNALAACGLDPGAVDCVIVATQSNLWQGPQLAPRVAQLLGIGPVGAYDILAGCAGFGLALSAAGDHIRSGSARVVLVIACEQVSQMLNRTDRDTAPIFGDGAGAAVVSADETPGLGPVVFGSDGSAAGALATRPSWMEFAADRDGPVPVLTMNGPDLARWVLRHVPKILERALASCGVTADDLAAFIPHQANGRITDFLIDSLALPGHVVVARDIADAGNTGAASVPLAMERLLSDGRAKPGDLALLASYGAGVAYAAQVIELPGAWRCTDLGGPA